MKARISGRRGSLPKGRLRVSCERRQTSPVIHHKPQGINKHHPTIDVTSFFTVPESQHALRFPSATQSIFAQTPLTPCFSEPYLEQSRKKKHGHFLFHPFLFFCSLEMLQLYWRVKWGSRRLREEMTKRRERRRKRYPRLHINLRRIFFLVDEDLSKSFKTLLVKHLRIPDPTVAIKTLETIPFRPRCLDNKFIHCPGWVFTPLVSILFGCSKLARNRRRADGKHKQFDESTSVVGASHGETAEPAVHEGDGDTPAAPTPTPAPRGRGGGTTMC